IAWWVEQMFGGFGEVRTNPDGSALFTTHYGSRRELLTWIMGMGPEAEIVDPPELRAAMIGALERVADRHAAEGRAPETRGRAPREPAPGPGEPAVRPPPQAPDRVVPAERFTRLLALMTRLLAACGASAEAYVRCSELRNGLNLDQRELEEDLGLLNLINFGG